MAYDSTESACFQETVERWINQRGEVSALIRYSHCAGARSFEFFATLDAFREMLRSQAPRTCITVFAERQLPLRGVVNDEFIHQAQLLIPDGTEFLLAGLDRNRFGWYAFHSDEKHSELLEILKAYCGERVALGPYPPWLVDSETVVSAVVPYPDGRVECGVY